MDAPVRAIGTPARRRRIAVGEQQAVPAATRDSLEGREQGVPFRCCRPVVAENDPASARQSARSPHQQVPGDAFVGEQPDGRHGSRALAGAHPMPIAARIMTDTPPATRAAAERLATIREAIAGAARVAGRSPEDVRLIAISKTHAADAIAPLIAAGQRVFGENRVQEAAAKWPALIEATPGLSLHLVGQLQSNKAAEAVALFDAIHSVDRSSLVAALAKAMDKAGRRPDCFIQVNIGAEEQKGGCAIAELPALLAEARAAALPVVGLMCVPPADLEAAPYFALLAKLTRDHGVERLSMGMSGDFETAVMLGATDVRVGSALFGERVA